MPPVSPPVSVPPVPVASAPPARPRTVPPPVTPPGRTGAGPPSRPYIGPVYGAGGKQVRTSAPGADRGGQRRPMPLIAAGIALFLVITGGGIALALTNNDNDRGPGGDPTTAAGATTAPAGPAVPLDEQCTDKIKSNPRWVCLTSATVQGDRLVIEYDAEWAGDTPTIQNGFHLHIYGSDGQNPSEDVMGRHAGNPGVWHIDDRDPVVLQTGNDDYQALIGDYPKVCARIARARHFLVKDSDGGYHTGNCIPIKQA
jgi:hypothetical protein